MKLVSYTRILPHELLFGGFLFITWARLIYSASFFNPASLVYLVFISANLFLIVACIKKETVLRWKLRLLFYPIVTSLTYLHLQTALLAIHRVETIEDVLQDALLQKIYGVLTLSIKMQSLIHPMLTELLSFCYLALIPYLVFSMLSYYSRSLELFKTFTIGLFSLYGVGFLGYTLLPAEGPYWAIPVSIPVEEWMRFTKLNSGIVESVSNKVDAFPSLHAAISTYLLFFDRIHSPKRYKFFLVPCIGMWIATLYLGHHYFVDLIAGFALAAGAVFIMTHYAINHGKEIEQTITPN